jgi:hypothetical protein
MTSSVPSDALTHPNPETRKKKLPRQFVTDQGSVYTLGSDNRYIRHKTKTSEDFPPQDVTVFMKMPEPYDPYFELHFLKAQQEGALLIVQPGPEDPLPEDGLITAQADIKDPDNLCVLAVDLPTGEIKAQVQASLYPALGTQVFEQRYEDDGTRSLHVGNRVVEISE